MPPQTFQFSYEVYSSPEDLQEDDRVLLAEAKAATGKAYAPYSKFYVGASARLEDGTVLSAGNQENASFPVGICAERSLLGAASSIFTDKRIIAIAVSCRSDEVFTDHPVSPCGMCRQAILEYETRGKQPIRLILAGERGVIYVLKSVSDLLPLAFTSSELGLQ
ncbi:MAG TPA: cytidine deaminase [Chitinophagaceae bacterium]